MDNVTLSNNTTAGGPGGAGGSGGFCICYQTPCSCTDGYSGFPGLTGPGGSSGSNGGSGSIGSTLGGGIYNESGTLIFRNTLAALNQASPGIDGYGDVTLQGPSLIEHTAGITLLGEPGAVISADPLLGPLQDYGGSVFTRALLVGSPAIDRGSALYCPATDARGQPRPIDGNADGVAVCDLGAFEYSPSLSYIYLPFVNTQ